MTKNHFGIAAIIASIFIPLSQLFAPIFGNIYLEKQRQKFEFKKLFVEYQDTSAIKQKTLYSKIKVFYPDLLAEYHDDFVKKTNNYDVLVNNRQDENTSDKSIVNARIAELNGFTKLKDENLQEAKKYFEKAYQLYPTLHNVKEISQLLKTVNLADTKNSVGERKDEVLKRIYQNILANYTWGMPNDIKVQLRAKVS